MIAAWLVPLLVAFAAVIAATVREIRRHRRGGPQHRLHRVPGQWPISHLVSRRRKRR